jgi:O-succinylbenzoic acid--CoA ligase
VIDATNDTVPQWDPRMPDVCVSGQWSSSQSLAGAADGWVAVVDERVGAGAVCAAALPSSAEGIALLGALSSRMPAFVALSGDPAAWPDAPLLRSGLPLVLPPSLAILRDEAARRGFAPVVLPPPSPAPRGGTRPWLTTDGVVVLSSGSTGAPKVVFRPMARIVAGIVARNQALGLAQGDGLVGGVPLSSGQGVVQVVTAMILGGAIGILRPRDHRDALALLEQPAFTLWRATPHYADVLGRCALASVPRMPPLCVLSSPVSARVFAAFRDRYGVPLRQTYSSTETGVVTVDGGPAPTVVHGSVGFAVDGVRVCIGDSPWRQVPAGTTARVWVKSPWLMAGYGAPPDVAPRDDVDGWWGTQDRGALDGDGRLTLDGRIDDAVRTRDGRLVNLADVANALAALPGVRHVVALPIDGDSGAAVGAVLECEDGVTFELLRPAISGGLPSWTRPRHTVIIPELPRLASGKPDRLACLALLAKAANHGAA